MTKSEQLARVPPLYRLAHAWKDRRHERAHELTSPAETPGAWHQTWLLLTVSRRGLIPAFPLVDSTASADSGSKGHDRCLARDVACVDSRYASAR